MRNKLLSFILTTIALVSGSAHLHAQGTLPADYISLVNSCLPRLHETSFVAARHVSNRSASARIDEIILHDTASSRNRRWEDAVDYMANPGDGRPVSIHYFVGKTSGQIVSMVPEAKRANHTKAGNHNDHSIGIELFRRKGETPYYTDWQYETIAQLVYDIMLRHGIGFDAIYGHGQLQSNRQDPENFDWSRFEQKLYSLDECAWEYTGRYIM